MPTPSAPVLADPPPARRVADTLAGLASGAIAELANEAVAGLAVARLAAAGPRLAVRTGLLTPHRPDRVLHAAAAVLRCSVSPASGYAAAAVLHPGAPALIDEQGRWTFAEVDRATNAIARGLAGLGVGPGTPVGLLARNSAWFVLADVALAKRGADICYLNTSFAAGMLADVLADAGAALLVADGEFVGALQREYHGRRRPGPRIVLAAPAESPPSRPAAAGGAASELPSLATLATGDARALPPPPRPSRHTILSSGTTGRPKMVAHPAPTLVDGVLPAAGLLSAIPLRERGTTLLAAPLFHAWGYGMFALSLVLRSTLVLTRRYDGAATARLLARHRADTLVAVPAMLDPLLAALPASGPPAGRRPRVVAVSGSAVPGDLAARVAAACGPVLYEVYGSTEALAVAVGSPADRRAAPYSVGRPLPGVRVRVLDTAGRALPAGRTGRVCVGSALTRQRAAGLLDTGDLGFLDAAGRLHVLGRGDDMVICGGENVYPVVVEDCLRSAPGVADVAVVGVADPRFGARLVAHVVAGGGDCPNAESLRAYVRTRLAGYQVPHEVVFHRQLPRNATGKVLTRTLVPAQRATRAK